MFFTRTNQTPKNGVMIKKMKNPIFVSILNLDNGTITSGLKQNNLENRITCCMVNSHKDK